MASVIASENTCQGYGNRISVAPHLFELDDDGLVRVRGDHLENADRPAAEAAVTDCPTLTLRIQGLTRSSTAALR